MSWDIVCKDMASLLNELFGVSLGYLVHKLSLDIVYKDVPYFLNEFFVWFLRQDGCENIWGYCLKGFSPKWALCCFFSLPDPENVLRHSLQRSGFSLKCKVNSLVIFSWEPALWTLNSQDRVLRSKKNHCNFHIETATFEHRHENKSCSACPKDNF